MGTNKRWKKGDNDFISLVLQKYKICIVYSSLDTFKYTYFVIYNFLSHLKEDEV